MTTFATERSLLGGFLAAARPRAIRSMRQFAEDEIWLPDGPYAGERFRVRRQPWSGLLLDEFDARRWRRFAVVGPVQDGKSLLAFIIPIAFHLAEIGETVVVGVTDLSMAADKWSEDIRPVFMASPTLRKLLPTTGAGARGGRKVEAVHLKNGATLRFMTAGGKEGGRAGFTTRIVALTEVDKFDDPGEASVETDKVSQIEARSEGYATFARTYLECTTTVTEGRIWREYQNGSASKIAVPCPRCETFVTPEREHLYGWQDARDALEAEEQGHIRCPACGEPWTDDERKAAQHDAVLVHKGQEVTRVFDGRHSVGGAVSGSDLCSRDSGDGDLRSGDVSDQTVVRGVGGEQETEGIRGVCRSHAAGAVGPAPRTHTFGFRWNAANSCLKPIGLDAAKEWNLRKLEGDKREAAERKRCQYDWAYPRDPPVDRVTDFDPALIAARQTADERGVVPKGFDVVTWGADVSGYRVHWTAIAWKRDATGHVVDYGELKVNRDGGVERGIMTALRTVRDRFVATYRAAIGFVDSQGRYLDVARAFARESEDVFAYAGNPVTRTRMYTYRHPAKVTARIVRVGDQWYVTREHGGDRVFHPNVDHWKTWTHARWAVPVGHAGALTLFRDPEHNHREYSSHQCAEREERFWDPKHGHVVRWVTVSRNNHLFDSTVQCCVGASVMGVRLMDENERAKRERPKSSFFDKRRERQARRRRR